MTAVRNGNDTSRPPLVQGRIPIFLSVVDTPANIDLNRGSFSDTRDRVSIEVNEALRGRSATMLILGQSNGANSGRGPYVPVRRVFNLNLFDGSCYWARDPLLGATESQGNFSTRMADMLIERGVFDSIVLIPISVGGSRIEEWTIGGARHRRLQIAIKRAADAGLAITHVLWHQGESNANHDPDPGLYVACFQNLHAALRAYGVNAPIYVAQATVCHGPPNEAIRAAQCAVVNAAVGICAGPDTDSIGPEDRFDDCHMSESGLIKHAELWVRVLTEDR